MPKASVVARPKTTASKAVALAEKQKSKSPVITKSKSPAVKKSVSPAIIKNVDKKSNKSKSKSPTSAVRSSVGPPNLNKLMGAEIKRIYNKEPTAVEI